MSHTEQSPPRGNAPPFCWCSAPGGAKGGGPGSCCCIAGGAPDEGCCGRNIMPGGGGRAVAGGMGPYSTDNQLPQLLLVRHLNKPSWPCASWQATRVMLLNPVTRASS